MSIHLINLVLQKSRTKKNARLVLLALADNASDEGYCYPKIETIAKKANVSINTAKIYIRAFDAIGLVKREGRSSRGMQTSNGYYINQEMIRDGKDEISAELIKSVTPPSSKNRNAPFFRKAGSASLPSAGSASLPSSQVSSPTYEPSVKPSLKTSAVEKTDSAGETEQPALPTMTTVAKPLTVKKPRALMTEEEAAVVNVWTKVNIQPPIPANDASPKEFKAFRKLWLSPVQQIIKAANGKSQEVALKAIQEQKSKRIAYGQPVSVLKRALEIAAEMTPTQPKAQSAEQAAAAIAAKTGIVFND